MELKEFDLRLNNYKRVGRAGFEPATFRLSVERSSRAELPAHMSFVEIENYIDLFIPISNILYSHSAYA